MISNKLVIAKKNSAVGGWRSLPAVNQCEFEVISHSLIEINFKELQL